MKAIDLFAGAGGFSTGAKMAGVKVVWAANHWPDAVRVHAENHPETKHICQDLHQAKWEDVPSHDLMLASPCCQGHSRARGKLNGNPQHDASRSTAWAVVSAAECHKQAVIVVENVPDFLKWPLFPAWQVAMKTLGYAISINLIDVADLGVPQNRERLFLVLTRSNNPIELKIESVPHVAAAKIIDLSSGKWSDIERPGRAPATLARIKEGRKLHGNTFISSYYGNERGGRSIDRPIGTITTRDRHAIINGTKMRMLTVDECRSAMTFPSDYILPKSHKLAVHMLGNAVPPLAVQKLLTEIMKTA